MDSTSKLVLVIDDSVSDRKIYRRYLTKESGEFRILEASSARDGISLCQVEKPDCIILDFRLPDQDGLTALKKIRESCQAPIIFISGDPEPSTITNAFRTGAFLYLSKDLLDGPRLVEVVRNAIQS